MFLLRPGHAFKAGLVSIAAACALFMASGPAQAQSADLFALRNVQVDIQGGDVAQARSQALVEAQRQAYQQLMQRLIAPADLPRVPKLSDKTLQDIVLDVGIDQEKSSTVRYLASLSVRFKPDAVRRILRNANIAYAEWRGRPVAVLPVLMADSGPILHEAVNPWRDAWKSPASQGVVPLAVPNPPTPDQANDPSLTAAAAALASPDTLAAIAQRTGTQDVLVAVAQPRVIDGTKARIDVTLTGLGPIAASLSGTRAAEGQPGEGFDVVMRRVVEDIARSAGDSWKSGNMLQFDRPSDLTVVVPLTGGLAEWSQMREKLVRVTPIRGYDVQSLSRSEVHLMLHTLGEQHQLEQVLAQNGLSLTPADDHWVLQTAQRSPAAPGKP